MSDIKRYDAIVVGSGLAGLTASLELSTRGLSVALIEKTDKLGGNSAKASSGINGVPTRFQEIGNGDTAKIFYEDTVASGKGLSDEKLVQILADNSAEAVHWLADHNIDLSSVSILGGHSHARTHRGSGSLPPGFAITSALTKKLESEPNVDIKTEHQLVKINKEGGKVVGIETESGGASGRILGKNLILATGGFSADFTGTESLIRRFRPDLLSFPLTNGQQTTGDGQKIAERDLSAELVHMDKIQVHPTGFIQLKDATTRSSKWKFLCGEVIRGIGGILVSSRNGKRFVNELATRDEVSSSIITHCTMEEDQPAVAMIIVSEKDYLRAKSHIDFYLFQKVMFKGDVNDMLEKLYEVQGHKVNSADIEKTLSEYNLGLKGIDSLGRKNRGHEIGPTFYFGFVTPVLHFAMGGIKINTDAQIITSTGAVENVFAIGEVSGGLHGHNRLGGSSLLECVVFGRKVAKYISERELKI